MGLDITAYQGIEVVREAELDTDGDVVYDYGTEMVPYLNPHFPDHAGSVRRAIYSFKDEYDFRAGSYGGYSAWREKIAGLMDYPHLREGYGWEAPEGAPFTELLFFSDCEGVIGPEISRKLLMDFILFEQKAEAVLEQYDMERYRSWKKAFEMASQNGAVCFH